MKMREKAKELQRQRVEAAKRAITNCRVSAYCGRNSQADLHTCRRVSFFPIDKYVNEILKIINYFCFLLLKTDSKANGPSKALKLGGRLKDAENFVDQLKSEGEHVNSNVTSAAVVKGGPISNNKIPSSTIATEPYVLNLAFENYLDK